MAVKIHAKADARQALSRIEELQTKVTAATRRLHVYVGVFGTATYGEGPSAGMKVADVARANNFGTITAGGFVPPRPFLTDAFKAPQDALMLRRTFKNGLQRNLKGADSFPKAYRAAMESVGLMAQGHVQKRIQRSLDWAEPNAPSTVRRKGEDKPLRETATLFHSVTYKVK